jgi:hypothetical protein
MPRPKTTGDGPVITLETAVTSYVLAQVGMERMKANLPALAQFLRQSGLGDHPPERLSEMVAKEARRLGAGERREELMAKAFTREGAPRGAKHRHAAAFCPECGMYKDHQKECRFCGRLEMTR